MNINREELNRRIRNSIEGLRGHEVSAIKNTIRDPLKEVNITQHMNGNVMRDCATALKDSDGDGGKIISDAKALMVGLIGRKVDSAVEVDIRHNPAESLRIGVYVSTSAGE